MLHVGVHSFRSRQQKLFIAANKKGQKTVLYMTEYGSLLEESLHDLAVFTVCHLSLMSEPATLPVVDIGSLQHCI